MQAVKIVKTYANNFVIQKIKSLNIMANLSEKTSKILKKNFIYLGLEKKKVKKTTS